MPRFASPRSMSASHNADILAGGSDCRCESWCTAPRSAGTHTSGHSRKTGAGFPGLAVRGGMVESLGADAGLQTGGFLVFNCGILRDSMDCVYFLRSRVCMFPVMPNRDAHDRRASARPTMQSNQWLSGLPCFSRHSSMVRPRALVGTAYSAESPAPPRPPLPRYRAARKNRFVAVSSCGMDQFFDQFRMLIQQAKKPKRWSNIGLACARMNPPGRTGYPPN